MQAKTWLKACEPYITSRLCGWLMFFILAAFTSEVAEDKFKPSFKVGLTINTRIQIAENKL